VEALRAPGSLAGELVVSWAPSNLRGFRTRTSANIDICRRFLPRDQPLTVAADEIGKHPPSEMAAPSTFLRSNSSTANHSKLRNNADAESEKAIAPDSADPNTSNDASTHRATHGVDSMATQERRYRLDPLYIENPLAPQTNVTRNCFRIYRIQRLFSDSVSPLLQHHSRRLVHPRAEKSV
jgi:hypothetical protein